jgi:hypothetical protein
MQADVQQFASQPKPVGTKGKYRDTDEGYGKSNIMHDKRVVRGNTYSSVVDVRSTEDPAEVARKREAQRRRLMRANQTKKRPQTPEAVNGRKHMDIQTDSYMEELTERTVEFEAETQTDFLLDRPPSPLFMPAKIGIDIETQIEFGELFDFDVECEPVLEVLVGKTLEQSMMEVLEEEELESLRRHQEDFEKRRAAELLEVQRMEAAEKRRDDELQRRIQQQSAQREVDLSIMRKVASRSISSAYLGGLQDRALAHLLDAGVFTEAAQKGVETVFMPTLFKMVQQSVAASHVHHEHIGGVMQKAVDARIANHAKVLQVEKDRLKVIDDAALEARREVEHERKLQRELEAFNSLAKQAMEEWEMTKPPENEVVEMTATSFDEATKIATLRDKCDEDRQITVPDEMCEELKGLLQQIAELPEEEQEGKSVQSKVEIVEDEVAKQLGLPAEPAYVLKSFGILGPPAEEGAAAADAVDAEAAAADGPVEEPDN